MVNCCRERRVNRLATATKHKASLLRQKRFEVKKDLFKECNKQASRYALFAVNAIFLLNGSAATVTLARGMILPAIACSIGAFIAIVCMAIAYLAMLGISEVWKPDGFEKQTYKVFLNLITVGASNCEKYRSFCFLLWVLSALSFVVGVGMLIYNIYFIQRQALIYI